MTLDEAEVGQRVKQGSYVGKVEFIRRPNSRNTVWVRWHKGYATWEDVSTLEPDDGR